jgi:predicted XRE-type DNA-binding protein
MIRVDLSEKAEHDRLRQILRCKIIDMVDDWQVPQVVAAERLGVERSYLNRVINDGERKASIDTLIVMLLRAGRNIKIEIVDE